MENKIILLDGTVLETFAISEVGNLLEINKNQKMFCFTLELNDGSFKNICFHYNQNNKMIINQKAMSFHKKVSSCLYEKERIMDN